FRSAACYASGRDLLPLSKQDSARAVGETEGIEANRKARRNREDRHEGHSTPLDSYPINVPLRLLVSPLEKLDKGSLNRRETPSFVGTRSRTQPIEAWGDHPGHSLEPSP